MTYENENDPVEKTPLRKESEHRAWEIIHDAPMPIDFENGKLNIDFGHLASDIADVIENAEVVEASYKANLDEALRLLGMSSLDDEPVKDPDREEYWWVNREGRVVPAAVVFEGDEVQYAKFFGTDMTAKPAGFELIARFSAMVVPFAEQEREPTAAETAVRKVLEAFESKASGTDEQGYADGYRQACRRVFGIMLEQADKGKLDNPAGIVEATLLSFNNGIGGAIPSTYSAGFSAACRDMRGALAEVAAR
jgi:hypothetical protein